MRTDGTHQVRLTKSGAGVDDFQPFWQPLP
jgi:hypothetical protein